MAVLDTAELVLRANRYSGSGNWLDESGNGHDATPVNSPSWDGEKFTLNGVDQYFTVPDADGLDPVGDFTAIIVAATDPTPVAIGGLFNKRADQLNGWWGMFHDPPNARISVGINDGTDAVLPNSPIGSVTPAVRFAASMRVDRASDLFIVSVDDAHAPRSLGLVDSFNSTSPMVVGARNVSGVISGWFKGDIYGAAIFTTALTDQEIEQAGQELIAAPAGPSNRMGGVGAIRRKGGPRT